MNPKVLIGGAIFSFVTGIFNPERASECLTSAIVLTWMGMAAWAK